MSPWTLDGALTAIVWSSSKTEWRRDRRQRPALPGGLRTDGHDDGRALVGGFLHRGRQIGHRSGRDERWRHAQLAGGILHALPGELARRAVARFADG